MVIGFIIDFLKQKDKSVSQKTLDLKNYYSYYKNLKKHINDKTIFATHEIPNQDFEDLFSKLNEFDFILIKKLFRDNIKNSLKDTKLQSKLKFSKPNDLVQVGMGSLWLNEPFPGLWTTSTAFFYLPIIPNVENHFKIELFSIPSINGEIGIDGKKTLEFDIDELSNKELKFKTKPTNNSEYVSEIFINTKNLWLPNLIIERDESVLLGVGIKSITNESIKN